MGLGQQRPWASTTMRFAILGNSGSGKSTLAKLLAQSANLAVLDLDSVAWEPDQPAIARADALAEVDVSEFCNAHPNWVVEGCYGNLIETALLFDPFLIFLNPGIVSCRLHCLSRPWEQHKYATKEEQDANLQFLLSWVAEYYVREGPTSLAAHSSLFNKYLGRKIEFQHVLRLNPPEAEVLALLR